MSVVKGVRIDVPREAIADFCCRHHIRKLSFFGSVLRDEFGAESDVDILVELESGYSVGLLTFAGWELELSEILGRRVDLNTPKSLSPYFRDVVLADARPLYVAA
jgi:hypothetical protein